MTDLLTHVTEVESNVVSIVEVTCAPRSTVWLGLQIKAAVDDFDALDDIVDPEVNDAHLALDTKHLWVWNGSTWDDWGIQHTPVPYPLYTITGYTATLPGSETAVANYATLAALFAAVPPTYQGQHMQVANGARVELRVGRWTDGEWQWIEEI